METKSPILAQAKEFAEGVHAVHPEQWLAYNLSPSFNWDAAGLDTNAMKDYVWELGKLGFVCSLSFPVSAYRANVSTVLAIHYVGRPTLECLHLRLVRQELCERRHESLCRTCAEEGEGRGV
jgi:isocitrate lyase